MSGALCPLRRRARRSGSSRWMSTRSAATFMRWSATSGCFGPYPSAALYIRRDVLDQIEVTWSAAMSPKGQRDDGGRGSALDSGRPPLRVWRAHLPTTRRWPPGSPTWSGLGIEAIEAHAKHLTAYFHEGLQRVPGAHIHSPREPARRDGHRHVLARQHGRGDRFDGAPRALEDLQRAALRGTSVRISLAAFIEECDVDKLVEKLRIVATE